MTDMVPEDVMMMGSIDSVAYAELLKTIWGSKIIAHWPLWDASGLVADDYSPNNFNGAYTNTGITLLGAAGIGDGRRCASFDGVNGYINLYSAALRAAFNGAEGTLLIWMGPSAAGGYAVQLRVDGNNLVALARAGATSLTVKYNAGSGANNKSYTITDVSFTEPFLVAITWSKSNDRIIPYVKGIQAAATTTGLGTWTGLLSTTRCNIGCDNQTGPTSPYSGGLAHCVLLNAEATADEILQAAAPNGIAPWSVKSWTLPAGGGSQPFAMIELDDKYESAYLMWKTYLEPVGIPVTFNLETISVGTAGTPTHISVAQVQEMHAAGCAMANHMDGNLLTGRPQADVEAAINQAIADLTGWGTTGAEHDGAYPNGGVDATVLAAMAACNMLTGRKVYTATSPDRYPLPVAAEKYVIWSSRELGGSGLTPIQIINLIDEAISLGRGCLLYGHRMEDPATDNNYWEPWKYAALRNYIGLKNLPTITRPQFRTMFTGPITVTRI